MTTEQNVERRKNLPAHRLGFINTLWLSLAVGSWCVPALACVRNPVYVPPTTTNEAARSHSVVVATLSTYRVLPTPKQSTDSDFYEEQREGTFIVLFTIKGNAKAGDLILVRDSPNSCDEGFHAQFTQSGADQKVLMATSNT